MKVVAHVLDTLRNLDTPYFRSIAERHDASQYMVHFCLTQEPEVPALASTPFHGLVSVLGTSARFSPSAILGLRRVLKARSVSLVHAHFFYPTLLATLAARLAGVPFAFTRHHSDHNIRLGKWWHMRVDAWCARRADLVIAVSEATKRCMVEIEGVPGDKVSVVYNGMHPLREPELSQVERVRTELALGSRPVCLMIARLHEEKGHTYLFQALPRVVERVGPVTVLLAGQGVHRQQLEDEVRARNLQERIRFVGYRADVPVLIALADLIVLPSLAESFGFALVEAMSLGKPCVASNSGGIPEVVEHGKTGLVVPTRDPDALASAMVSVLQDRDFARRLGEAGRRRAGLFSFERMIAGYEKVYAEIWRRHAVALPGS